MVSGLVTEVVVGGPRIWWLACVSLVVFFVIWLKFGALTIRVHTSLAPAALLLIALVASLFVIVIYQFQ